MANWLNRVKDTVKKKLQTVEAVNSGIVAIRRAAKKKKENKTK